MKENNAVAQEIGEINFVPEESKKFYYHIKILKSVMNANEVFYIKSCT